MLYYVLHISVFICLIEGQRGEDGIIGSNSIINATELISSKGYPVMNYNVQTVDGYILSVQRIPYGISGIPDVKRGPVLLMHGFLSSSAEWVMNNANQSLGFILADAGYDVWLGNVRGNVQSTGHASLNPKTDTEYWDFTIQEMAKYDLPAMIDFVLETTNQTMISYIGFAQGNVNAFALLSESPEYNHKLRILIALSPVAFLGNINVPKLRYLSNLRSEITMMMKLLGNGEFPPKLMTRNNTRDLCSIPLLEKLGCEEIYEALVGPNGDSWNASVMTIYHQNFVGSSSVWYLEHLAQLVISKKFQMFDYRKRENLRKYGRNEPPEYQLESITAPVALISSLGDKIEDSADIEILRGKLKNVVYDKIVDDVDFSHMDFVYNLNARRLVYDDVLQILSLYDESEELTDVNN